MLLLALSGRLKRYVDVCCADWFVNHTLTLKLQDDEDLEREAKRPAVGSGST